MRKLNGLRLRDVERKKICYSEFPSIHTCTYNAIQRHTNTPTRPNHAHAKIHIHGKRQYSQEQLLMIVLMSTHVSWFRISSRKSVKCFSTLTAWWRYVRTMQNNIDSYQYTYTEWEGERDDEMKSQFLSDLKWVSEKWHDYLVNVHFAAAI